MIMKQQGQCQGGEAHGLRVGLAVPGKVGDDVDEDAPRSAQKERRQLQHQGREPPHTCMAAAPQLVTPTVCRWTCYTINDATQTVRCSSNMTHCNQMTRLLALCQHGMTMPT